MALLILFLLLATPIIEIATFVEVGGKIGVWPTLGLVITTAVVGTALLRAQGLATLARVRDNLNRGALPVDEVLDGFFLVIAGALLLTPGFVTDGIGLLLFVPAVRRALKSAMRRNVTIRGGGAGHAAWRDGGHHGAGPGRPESAGAVIIDGDYQDVTPEADGTDSGGNKGEPGPNRKHLPPR